MINQDPSEKNTSVGRLKAHVDGPLVVTVMLILAFGLIMLFSASMVGSLYKSGGSTSFFITRQILFMALGVAAIIAMSKINIRRFDRKPWGNLVLPTCSGTCSERRHRYSRGQTLAPRAADQIHFPAFGIY